MRIVNSMEYAQILKELRKEDHSVVNRVQSILYDSKYVEAFSEYPLVANERCGLWYVPPSKAADSAYFKSTDGHSGQWMFSLRRLNLHILPLFQRSSVIVLVDSTRKGKLMPDAMSKTVPIWCAVLNYIMFDGEDSEAWAELRENNWLVSPRVMVSENEHSSIMRRIPEHASAVRRLGLVTKEILVGKLGVKKPLIPFWMYPGKKSQQIQGNSDYFTVCCLTASIKATPQTTVPQWNYSLPYVQGAGDDHELWASKAVCDGVFNHTLLWNHVCEEKSPELQVFDAETQMLYSWLTEHEFIDRINQIYVKSQVCEPATPWNASQLGSSGIYCGKIMGNINLEDVRSFDKNICSVVVLSEKFSLQTLEKCPEFTYSDAIECNKKGSKKLREILPKIIQTLPVVSQEKKVLVLCDSGTDISVAVVLCILCRFFDLAWQSTDSPPHVNKDVIKKHLGMISDFQKCNPSRNTLQSVNAVLI